MGCTAQETAGSCFSNKKCNPFLFGCVFSEKHNRLRILTHFLLTCCKNLRCLRETGRICEAIRCGGNWASLPLSLEYWLRERLTWRFRFPLPPSACRTTFLIVHRSAEQGREEQSSCRAVVGLTLVGFVFLSLAAQNVLLT